MRSSSCCCICVEALVGRRRCACAPRRRRTARRARAARARRAQARRRCASGVSTCVATRRRRRCRRGGSPPTPLSSWPCVPRLLLAEAHRLDLDLGGAEQHHHPLHRVGALLAERDVVLARAALVGVALERHLQRCGCRCRYFACASTSGLYSSLTTYCRSRSRRCASGQDVRRIACAAAARSPVPAARATPPHERAGRRVGRRAPWPSAALVLDRRRLLRACAAQQPASAAIDDRGEDPFAHVMSSCGGCDAGGGGCARCQRGSGPQAGSRTSVAGETSRCFTRPSPKTSRPIYHALPAALA